MEKYENQKYKETIQQPRTSSFVVPPKISVGIRVAFVGRIRGRIIAVTVNFAAQRMATVMVRKARIVSSSSSSSITTTPTATAAAASKGLAGGLLLFLGLLGSVVAV